MRIAFFTETFFPQINGVSTSIASFAKELVKQGHEVELFAPAPGPSSFEDIPVHRFRSFTFKPYPEFRATLPVLRVSKIMKGKTFDIVHTHGPFAMGWLGQKIAKKYDIPSVSTFHTPISDYVQYLFGKRKRLVLFGKHIAWKYTVFHYNSYDMVLTPSYAIKHLLMEKGVKAPIEVIRTGIDLRQFDSVKKSDKIKEAYGLDQYILHTGRLSYEKNISDVIRAMPSIIKEKPSVKLVITSKGPIFNELKALVSELNLKSNIIFTGYVENDDLIRLYKSAECAVIASEAETQGIVILEEMACSLPVVGANYLAIPETIEDGKNGFLFELHDEKQMAEKILTILDSKRTRNKLSKNARKTAEQNTIEKWTKKLVQIYEKLNE
ncbi:MAG: glycosyltransferase [Candidatus Diapherotrites archaeon]|nr:glycosyltransferase [Candidatus Diapherotrites archaeon]